MREPIIAPCRPAIEASGADPAHPEEELLESLREAVALVRGFLAAQGFRFDEDEVIERVDVVFRHVFRAYPTLPSPYYTLH